MPAISGRCGSRETCMSSEVVLIFALQIKCDAAVPKCNWCSHHDTPCTFERKIRRTRKRAGAAREYVFPSTCHLCGALEFWWSCTDQMSGLRLRQDLNFRNGLLGLRSYFPRSFRKNSLVSCVMQFSWWNVWD